MFDHHPRMPLEEKRDLSARAIAYFEASRLTSDEIAEKLKISKCTLSFLKKEKYFSNVGNELWYRLKEMIEKRLLDAEQIRHDRITGTAIPPPLPERKLVVLPPGKTGEELKIDKGIVNPSHAPEEIQHVRRSKEREKAWPKIPVWKKMTMIQLRKMYNKHGTGKSADVKLDNSAFYALARNTISGFADDMRDPQTKARIERLCNKLHVVPDWIENPDSIENTMQEASKQKQVTDKEPENIIRTQEEILRKLADMAEKLQEAADRYAIGNPDFDIQVIVRYKGNQK